jgi:hypothetical protein
VVLEQLQFVVHPSVKDDWLKFEDEEWLPWLQQQRGFISKQIRLSSGIATSMIWWKDRESWDNAADKREEITAKDLKMRGLFGSKVTRLRAI